MASGQSSWAIVREVTGDDPTVEQVAEWWKTPYRTAYREQAAFRAAFPTLESPSPIFESQETRARLAQAAQAALKSDAAKKSRKALSDLSVLQVGMTPATV